MKKVLLFSLSIVLLSFAACGGKAKNKEENKNKNAEEISRYDIQSGKVIPCDKYWTGKDTLYVTLLGHASLMFEFDEEILYFDPYSQVTDFSVLPKADYIYITHEHADHLDTTAIKQIEKEGTKIVAPECTKDILGSKVEFYYTDHTNFSRHRITGRSVLAYNIINKKPNGEAYHPRGRGVGYVIAFDSLTVYVAGDTENIPEMDELKGTVDIAFMPKNLPYTMTDEMFIDAVKRVEPKVVYPYHMSEFDQEKIGKALEGTNVKIEVRPMKN
ncbi:L-ascorbate metabolism protein UlaG (beta-lactamase superfamily) [Dysgonomonas sp. PFB1-18]|uniref:MBL fold metallo-hydrolase n=1 Tax=unclassified Dysgonomonas TaxID=2630389 RepID=UPI002475EBA9|nr:MULTISPECIES: MBL fold metallo-hydrolase [unclassified Dysgonomonas]MDH6309666.1 L-ascorbate metabolism protein UlaG (beta-lactamase superfamily) [Dysgonomonas sp. PF1-14]MDH6339326.1 L-ascorbate metabolism protein UlaG (beta-lactamase superfamily) [Dysgonomonas sp. PF1-16]MDH6380825.1 L-ascorbate metabolism protein UlaG (beta-lactamase superfamily) [Dysgonomonas sp. PFB1-18]MDH6398321.1 L-ascorbate metabolism protein UlaG (beta-lactamase superfamily) [Dysgonomonas sp. PF1-23]